MLTFLIPVKPNRYVTDEDKMTLFLQQAVSSCMAVPNSRVLIIANPSSAHWITPIAAASPHNEYGAGRAEMMLVDEASLPYGDRDKGMKLLYGCKQWLRLYEPTERDHVMPLDCDDLVRRDINKAAFTGCSTALDSGYLQVWNRLFLRKKFWYKNGSSHILSKSYIQQEIAREISDRFLYHLDIRRNDDCFKFVSEPYVVQRIWHGENVYYAKKGAVRGVAGYQEESFMRKLAMYILRSHRFDKQQFVV